MQRNTKMKNKKVEIIQRPNIGELEKAINEFIKNKNVTGVNISVTSIPVYFEFLFTNDYRQYFYACVLYEKNNNRPR